MIRLILSLALVCAASSWAAPEWIHGEITRLSVEKAQLTVMQEASMRMAAMSMPYKVTNAALLKGFKPGDVVRFSVKTQGDAMLIDALEHAK
jgi:Cu/Ag efflux protein CusF